MLIFITCFVVFILGMLTGIAAVNHTLNGFKELVKNTVEDIRKDNEGYMQETLKGFKDELALAIFEAQSLANEEEDDDDDDPGANGFLN